MLDEAVQKALRFVSRCQNLETAHNTLPFAPLVNDGGFYYTAAGLHAAHVIAGAIIMGFIAVDAAKGKELQRVELIGIYWHFVDVVWIFLFPLLYIAK